jgi:hypothetical protein|tara:strand:- start:389 stop:544 length:156 start_codon:yes stop_codon:yes gene_type:complete
VSGTGASGSKADARGAKIKLQRRTTSGDMSVFTHGESAADACLTKEGGKPL